MFNACRQSPAVELLSHKIIDFPSGSGLSFRNDTLYLFGDNAPSLLLLDKSYGEVGRYNYWKSNTPVIAKDEKPDIESAMIIDSNRKPVLIGVASMSGENRWTSYAFAVGEDSAQSISIFRKGTTFKGIDEINIEGSTAFREKILFGNRGNLSTPKNHLLLWSGDSTVLVKEIVLAAGNHFAGLSGLHYVPEKDLLLFTASEEATASAHEDGAIGDSYLGWISHFSEHWKNAALTPTNMLQLAAVDKAFRRQKIESVCVEKQQGRRLLLHLAADNDGSKTVLFKLALTL